MDEKDCLMLRALKECGNITQASAQLFISQKSFCDILQKKMLMGGITDHEE